MIFTEAAMPTAQPVSYLLDDEEVVFRTAGGGKLAVATRHHVVAFAHVGIGRLADRCRFHQMQPAQRFVAHLRLPEQQGAAAAVAQDLLGAP